jgi:adenylate kinase
LKENRLDDASTEVIRRRWRVYETESQPILDHYPSEIVQTIDASGTPVRVLHDILGYLI